MNDRKLPMLAAIGGFFHGPVIYALCEPETGEVRYIGMATDLQSHEMGACAGLSTTTEADLASVVQEVGEADRVDSVEEPTND
jgi:hypothetical protein